MRILLLHVSTLRIMRKDKITKGEPKQNLNTDVGTYISTPQKETDEADEIILEQINKRKDENQALKKLLKNLNSITGK